jgi:hypothetical protein
LLCDLQFRLCKLLVLLVFGQICKWRLILHFELK